MSLEAPWEPHPYLTDWVVIRTDGSARALGHVLKSLPEDVDVLVSVLGTEYPSVTDVMYNELKKRVILS